VIRATMAGLLTACGLGAVAGAVKLGAVSQPQFDAAFAVPPAIVFALLTFVGGVVGAFLDRWRERIADRIEIRFRPWQGGVERAYRKHLYHTLRFIDVRGLATVGFYQPELYEVFVDVSLSHRPPGEVAAGVVPHSPAEASDRHFLMDFLGQARPRILAVVGIPGSGKTTLVRYVGRKLSHGRRKVRRNIPIIIYLRDVADGVTNNPDLTLPDVLNDTVGRKFRNELPAWIERRLARGECTVLLDGLDEVGARRRRVAVANWVERQIKIYPENDFVITSRPHGYRGAHIDGATFLQVRGFTSEQVADFVHAWYLAVEKHSADDTVADARDRAEAAARDLLGCINRTPALYELSANPLLLTMIANVHRYRGALPGSRARLYEEICQVMLWRREEAKQLSGPINGDDKETLLREVAFAMMTRRVRDLSRAEVVELVGPGLARTTSSMTTHDFLADITTHGLLIERDSDVYTFAHMTFQEHLAAAHIREHGAVHILIDAVDDPWWREVTLLYVARSHADAIVSACLRSGSVVSLSLAFDCAEQCGQLAPALREQLEQLLRSALAPGADEERHRLMVGIMVARHFREQVTTTSGSRVCVNAVTNDLYSLFVADTGTPAPEGPATTVPSRQAGTAPVTGVWRDDVRAFLGWLNSLMDKGQTFRLAYQHEIEDPAVMRLLANGHADPSAPTVWIGGVDSTTVELWVPRAVHHPHLMETRTIYDRAYRLPQVEVTWIRVARLRAMVGSHMLRVGLGLIGERRAVRTTRSRPGDLDLARSQVLDVAYDLRQTVSYLQVNSADDPVLRSHAHALRTLERLLDRALTTMGWSQAESIVHTIHDDIRAMVRAATPTDVSPLEQAMILSEDCEEILTRLSGGSFESLFESGLIAVMGLAVANALGRVLRLSSPSSTWTNEMVQAIAQETARITSTSFHVDLPDLEAKLDRATQSLLEVFAATDAATAWARHATVQMRDIGMAQFARREPPSPAKLAAVRLVALCLAKEVRPLRRDGLTDLLYEICAGATLIEQRLTGSARACEQLIIAA
jgi:hypothetical protein